MKYTNKLGRPQSYLPLGCLSNQCCDALYLGAIRINPQITDTIDAYPRAELYPGVQTADCRWEAALGRPCAIVLLNLIGLRSGGGMQIFVKTSTGQRDGQELISKYVSSARHAGT